VTMMKRDQCLRILARHLRDEIVVSTYSSAHSWHAINDRPLNYFSIGAMGLASSHGLGLALGLPRRRVIVLDGDGSLLMNLGSLVTIAAAAPKNLIHFVCQNGSYEANGGHPLPNPEVDFAGTGREAVAAERDGVAAAVLDDAGGGQQLLKVQDATLDEGLLVLAGFVFGIFRKPVAFVNGVLQALGDFLAADGLQMVQLRL